MIDMPERVRLDPDYPGFEQQVIGWAVGSDFDNDIRDWPEYIIASHVQSLIAEAVETAVREERERAGWQLAETAPKDGTVLRLFFPAYVRGDLFASYHSPGQREGFWAQVGDYGRWVTPGTMSSENPQPTHWRALPEPPVTDREDG